VKIIAKEEFWKALEEALAKPKPEPKKRIPKQISQLELVRRDIDAQVKVQIAKHKESLEQARLVGQEKLIEVILPWWEKDILKSGLLVKLLELKRKSKVINLALSNQIFFINPVRLRREMEYNNPFYHTAYSIVTEPKYWSKFSIEDEIKDRVLKKYSEEWWARFYLTRQHSGETGLRLRIEPKYQPTGCGSQHIEQNILIIFDGQSIKLPAVNPNVIVEFASQITDGKVWERLERSIRGKR